ncbi:glycosyltransferase family 2 protein [Algoriphagus confluentis]|uniref:PGL/p-HBAD biosynthesis glycosyltransferase n=1 Tax=Algoriphagus confluentis TaxID=1697556 RepID=A0ABQ6PNN6_9BACT|nr:PGL/p-HBAD biosynthesis glycosyltransferase [Algoriphagus confluentis]
MFSPFFSIIIPCFNSEKTVYRCVKSVINQSFSNYEILIIDSKSSDNTLIEVRRFNDFRIKIHSHLDLGVYDAMNKGINLARGQWIYFLGSDDVIYSEHVFQNIYRYIYNENFSVIYGNVKVFGDVGWAKDGDIYAGKFSKNRMLFKSICHQSILYKRDFLILNNLFFDLRYPVSADWHLNLRCRRLTKFKYVNLIIAVFTAGGISTLKRDTFPEQIKTEFADLFPSRGEVILNKIFKLIIRIFK